MADEDIARLERKLLQVTETVAELSEEIARLKSGQVNESVGPDALTEAPVTPDVSSADDEPEDREISEPANESIVSDAGSSEEAVAEDPWQAQPPPEREPAEPGFIRVFVEEVIVRYGLLLVSRLLGPVTAAIEAASGLYSHYQKQGKAPVFLMTAVGIVALVSGFGYGLQYAFINVLNDAAKVAMGFALGIGVTGVGAYLSIRKPDYREYAASVIGLGVVFNYLSAYFVGPYFSLVSELVTFVILSLITAIAYVLARYFETRIVAVITLVGGSLSPVILGELSLVNTEYVVYLLVLVSANLHLARKIDWPVLAQLSFLLSVGMLEHSAYGSVVGGAAAMLLYLVFFNLFAYYWSFHGLRLKESLSRTDLGILISNLFYLLYSVISASVNPVVGACLLAVNAALFGGVLYLFQIMRSVAAPVFIMITASLVAAAVFVVSPLNIMGALWAAEGVALIYIGFFYQQKLIRVEGYAIYAIALLSLLWQLLTTLNLTALGEGWWSWFDLLVTGGLLWVSYRLIQRYRDQADRVELILCRGLNELFTFWGAVLLVTVAATLWLDAVFVLAILPIAWCYHRTLRHDLGFAPVVGFVLLLGFVIQIALGMFDSWSRLLSDQSVLTLVAVDELFVVGWGIQSYYEWRAASVPRLARIARTGATLLPLLLLLSAAAMFQSYTLAETWWVWLDVAVVVLTLTGGHLVYLRLVSVHSENAQGEPSEVLVEHSVGGIRQRSIVEETLSLAVAVLFLYTVSIFSVDWMFVASLIPFMALLYRGVHQQLKLTEIIGWLHIGVLLFGIYRGFLQSGSMHFSDQSLVTQCALFTLFVCAWVAPWVYARSTRSGQLQEFAELTRIVAYLAVPLCYLPSVSRHAPELFGVAVWMSFLVSWLMHKRLGIGPLLVELRMLFAAAVLVTVITTLQALEGAASTSALLAIGASIVVLLLIQGWQRVLVDPALKVSDYRHIYWASVHYFGFCIGAVVFALTWNLAVASLSVGVYYALVCLIDVTRPLTRPSLNASHGLAIVCLSLIPVMAVTGVWRPNGLVTLGAVLVLGALIHLRYVHNRVLINQLGGPAFQYYLFHAMVAAAYLSVSNQWFGQWSVAATIGLLLHAVVVLFMTVIPRFSVLLRLSLLLYAATAIKLLLHDLTDFGALVRFGALMAIGVILMVAAYYYQKVANLGQVDQDKVA
jgi:hypothetical protein